MNGIEAAKIAMNGGKIRLKCDPLKSRYIYWNPRKEKFYCSDDYEWDPAISKWLILEWEIYKEPSKPLKNGWIDIQFQHPPLFSNSILVINLVDKAVEEVSFIYAANGCGDNAWKTIFTHRTVEFRYWQPLPSAEIE